MQFFWSGRYENLIFGVYNNTKNRGEGVQLCFRFRPQNKPTMQNKLNWLLLVVLVVSLASCAGSRSSKGCGCPQKNGMVGY
jgi:hypothetical protein